MKKCKHNWHFIAEFVRGDLENSIGAWLEAEFICDKCGRTKFVRVIGEEKN